MTTAKHQLGIALAAAVAVPLVLTGCSSDDAIARDIETAVSESAPHITGSYASLAYSGLQRTVWVRVYVDTIDDEELSVVVDRALEAAWMASEVKPSRITIDAHEGSRPDAVEVRARSGVDLTAAAELLGIRDTAFNRVMVLNSSILTDRYGEWDDAE